MRIIIFIISMCSAVSLFGQHPATFCEHSGGGNVAIFAKDTVFSTAQPNCDNTIWVNTTIDVVKKKIFPALDCSTGDTVSYYNSISGRFEPNPTLTIWGGGQSNFISASAKPTDGTETQNGSINVYSNFANDWILSNAGLLSTTTNNSLFHFAKELNQDCQCHIRIMPFGTAGAPIENFAAKTSLYYTQLDNRAAAVGVTNFDIMYWMQGQGNRDSKGGDSTSYHNSWDLMYSNWVTDGYVTANTKTVIKKLRDSGGLGFEDRNDALIAIAALNPKIGIADSDFTPLRDAVHFSTYGLTLYGSGSAYGTYLNIP